jgi:hypothetical protein
MNFRANIAAGAQCRWVRNLMIGLLATKGCWHLLQFERKMSVSKLGVEAGCRPMAKSLVLRRAELSKFGGELARRAAQYVRMSDIHQRFSIENQAAAIATYARALQPHHCSDLQR